MWRHNLLKRNLSRCGTILGTILNLVLHALHKAKLESFLALDSQDYNTAFPPTRNDNYGHIFFKFLEISTDNTTEKLPNDYKQNMPTN